MLQGKTIIITGASSGIGAAAARLLAGEGAAVVLGARRDDALAELAGEIRSTGGQAAHLAGDVSDGAYAAALVAKAVETFGGLDGAFNNAGTMGALGPVPEMAEDNWAEVIAVNLTSAFHAARHQIPAILARGGGSIVFTGSFVGYTNAGLPGMAAYAASKAGLVGLTQSLAAEHGAAGLRVNALLPGGTLTPMAGDDADFHAFVRNMHALKRMARPGEIAEAALFLISERSSFVTGTAMLADGGNSICRV